MVVSAAEGHSMACPGPVEGPPPWPDSLGRGGGSDCCQFLHHCGQFSNFSCKNEYSTFCFLSTRKVASSLRPLCLPGRGTLLSPLLIFPPLGIIAHLPDPWALLSYLHSQVLFKCVVTLFCKVIYKSLYN